MYVVQSVSVKKVTVYGAMKTDEYATGRLPRYTVYVQYASYGLAPGSGEHQSNLDITSTGAHRTQLGMPRSDNRAMAIFCHTRPCHTYRFEFDAIAIGNATRPTSGESAKTIAIARGSSWSHNMR